jgi:hypothetical protein
MTQSPFRLPALAALALCATALTPLHAAALDAPSASEISATAAPKYGSWG